MHKRLTPILRVPVSGGYVWIRAYGLASDLYVRVHYEISWPYTVGDCLGEWRGTDEAICDAVEAAVRALG